VDWSLQLFGSESKYFFAPCLKGGHEIFLTLQLNLSTYKNLFHVEFPIHTGSK